MPRRIRSASVVDCAALAASLGFGTPGGGGGELGSTLFQAISFRPAIFPKIGADSTNLWVKLDAPDRKLIVKHCYKRKAPATLTFRCMPCGLIASAGPSGIRGHSAVLRSTWRDPQATRQARCGCAGRRDAQVREYRGRPVFASRVSFKPWAR